MVDWTAKMEADLQDGIKKGLSAQLIADRIGLTRNAVLGKMFRMRIGHRPTIVKKPGLPKSKPIKPLRKRRAKIPPDAAEQFPDMRDMGMTFAEIADKWGVAPNTVYLWAKENGLHKPFAARYFSLEDVDYLCDAYQKHVTIEEMADHLKRSFGVVRQKILALQRSGLITVKRDPSKTRLLRQYGEMALAAGKTPSQALANMAELKNLAFQKGRLAAEEAKRVFKEEALAKMRADIAAGMDRNQAIFEARAKGLGLEEIADEFNITRERVRQIAFKWAETLALKELIEKQGKSKEKVMP